MYSKFAIFRAIATVATVTTLAVGPTATIHAASLDLASRESSAYVATAPRFQDGVPSSSVQPGSGAQSSQSVRAGNDGAPQIAGTPTPASLTGGSPAPRSSDQAPVNGRQTLAAPDGQPAVAGSLLVTFKSGTTAHSRTDANNQAQAVAAETVGRGNTVRVDVQSGSLTDAM